MLSWRVTYMERTVRPGDGPPPAPAGVTFTRECDIGPDAYRDLHRRVGEDWLWWERIVFDDAALRAVISDPATEILVLRADGDLAGFAELDRRDPESPVIRYFGLTSEFIGRGLGGYMMETVLHLAWWPSVRRITLDTCDLDHPAALPFYRCHGFEETHTEVRTAEDPRAAGILPMTAASHIPLNRQF